MTIEPQDSTTRIFQLQELQNNGEWEIANPSIADRVADAMDQLLNLIEALQDLQTDLHARRASNGGGPWEIGNDPLGSAISISAAQLEIMLTHYRAKGGIL